MRIGEVQKVKAESQLKIALDDCRERIAEVWAVNAEAASALEEKAEALTDCIERLKLLTGDEEWEHFWFEAEDLLGDLEKSCRSAKV